MAKTKDEAPIETRKKGPIVCKKGSDIAKRIEATHGFGAALKARDKRDGKKADTKGKGDS